MSPRLVAERLGAQGPYQAAVSAYPVGWVACEHSRGVPENPTQLMDFDARFATGLHAMAGGLRPAAEAG